MNNLMNDTTLLIVLIFKVLKAVRVGPVITENKQNIQHDADDGN